MPKPDGPEQHLSNVPYVDNWSYPLRFLVENALSSNSITHVLVRECRGHSHIWIYIYIESVLLHGVLQTVPITRPAFCSLLIETAITVTKPIHRYFMPLAFALTFRRDRYV
jgi:hypothetical protein